MNTRPESFRLQLPRPPPPSPILRSPAPTFFFMASLPLPFSSNYAPESPQVMHTDFPARTGSCCGHRRGWAGPGEGMRQADLGEEEVSWAPGKTGLSQWVGTVICRLSGHTETDRMDFLRLHLPGLHQALRGALVRGARRCQRLSPCSLGPPLPSTL